MFIRDEFSSESYVHVCRDKTKKVMSSKKVEIRMHDVSIFTFVRTKEGSHDMEHINFCPYCGCELSKDYIKENQ